MRRVVDCFKFCHELDRLELRLKILENVVDYFVLTEATVTHAGTAKPLFFDLNRHRFKPWLDRIRHVVVEDMPIGPDENHIRDRHQLDAIFRGVPPLQSSDILIVGDLDEVPNPKVIQSYRPEMGIMGLQCFNAFFFLNCEAYQVPWYNPKIVSYGIAKRVSPSGIRDYPADVWGHLIKNGGWHFSYCGGLKSFRYKIRSYCHSSMLPESWKDEDMVKWVLQEPQKRAIDLLGMPLRIRQVDASFPDYVRSHQLALRSKGLIWSP